MINSHTRFVESEDGRTLVNLQKACFIDIEITPSGSSKIMVYMDSDRNVGECIGRFIKHDNCVSYLADLLDNLNGLQEE
tara:strand:- start:3491 stop:3727 length:237 start_codon:yes stop_codon:yes gene_type:complete